MILRSAAVAIFALTAAFTAAAAPFDSELHHRILNTTSSSAPQVINNTAMFTYRAPPGTRVVSLAMEHEHYLRFHTFERNRNDIFILTLDMPEGVQVLRYRLVVDGLWTTDPNAQEEVDGRGIRVSILRLPAGADAWSPGVTRMSDGTTRFVVRAASGSRVHLAGDFNRWDPFLTPMNESPVHPGVYSATLRLPADARYYRYVVDGRNMIDPQNPRNGRNGWGEAVSILP